MLSVEMPNAPTFSALVETATKCLATSASSPSWPVSQSRADVALASVSCVVKVLDTTMNSVSAASRSRVASAMSVPSTLDTKRNCRSRWLKACSASYAMAGPRSEPPMPMLTTVRMRLPVVPSHDAGADAVAEGRHAVEHGVHLGDDVDPVDDQRRRARHAQRDVEHGAVLGVVDVLAGEHRGGPLPHPCLVGEGEQQPQRLVGDAVLGVVEVDVDRVGGQPGAARRVLRRTTSAGGRHRPRPGAWPSACHSSVSWICISRLHRSSSSRGRP